MSFKPNVTVTEDFTVRFTVGMSLIFTKSIIQHKFDIDIHIEIALKVLIFSWA